VFGADDAVSIEIHCYGNPRFIPEARRQREIREGLAMLDRVAIAHPRIGELLRDEPVDRKYVYNTRKGFG